MMYVLIAMIGLYLIVFVLVLFFRSRRSVPKRQQYEKPQPPKDYILIDGSNIMYWDQNTPKLQPVLEVIRILRERGYTPGVMFDANAGYLLVGNYQHDNDFAHLFGLPVDQILVAEKGVQADPYLLNAARDLNAKIVTNDLFRDWANDFPEVRKRGHLIHGGYHKGKLWLDFDGSRQRAQKHRRRKKR
jgi:hypothetical protein